MLALTVALVGPYFVDWTSYRADFEREASRILGREVTVEGSATARLLPFPSVSFSDVRVAGATPGEPAMTVESFSMDAELAPFLRGEVLIFDMRLVRPSATIRIAADGTVDWAMRPASRFEPGQISLERLTVSEGRVLVSHEASGRTHLVSEINADVSARTLAGPWRIDGSARLDGMLTELSVSTGTPDERGAMRVRVRAEPERFPLVIEADGSARFVDGAANYSGTFHLDARRGPRPDPADLQARDRPADFRFAGSFALDQLRLDVTEFRLETGPREDPYTADGTALVDFGADPRFLVQATGAQVRIEDALGKPGTQPGLALADRVAAVREALETLPRPAMRGTVDLDLPAIVAGDTTIRNVKVTAEPAEGGWTVHALSATLPGRTTLEASGFLGIEEDFGFRGKLLVAVAQPSGFAAWLARDIDEAVRRLPAAGFSAEVELAPERQGFRNLELVLGHARFAGSLERVTPPAGRPVMRATLAGDELDVDGMSAFASLFVSERGATHFSGHDVDLDLKAGPVAVSGIVAEAVDTKLRLRGDRLDVDRLTITGIAGADITATASLRDIASRPNGEVDASLLAGDLAPLARLVAERFPSNRLAVALARRADGFAGLLEEARVDMVGRLPADAADGGKAVLKASGRLGASSFSLDLSATEFDGDPVSAPLSLALEADSTDTAQLLAFVGLPVLELGLTGGGEASFKLDGRLAEGAAVGLVLSSPEARAEFSGVAQLAGDGFWAKGRVEAGGEDVEPWLMSVGAGLPGMGLGLPARLSAEADYAGGRLKLAGVEGSVADAPVGGAVEIAFGEDRPHFSGDLSLGTLDMASFAAMVLGEASLFGQDKWADRPFIPAVSAPFSADLGLSVASLQFGLDLSARDARMRLRLDPTGMAVTELSGEGLGGRFSGLVELKNNDGTGLFSAQVALDDAEVARLPGMAGLSGRLDASAALTASGKTVGGLVASLAGSGTASFAGLEVARTNGGALGGILAEADRIGREIDAARTAAFAPALIEDGLLAVADETVPFTVAGGVLRTPPFFLRGEGAVIAAEARADIGAERVGVTGTITFSAGDEALVGSEPQVGFAVEGPPDAALRTLDTAPLAQFLTQRALEREQARVEAMQAGLLEKQRLRREVRYYAQLDELRRRAAEEEARRRAEEERLRLEEEARQRAEEQARLAAQEAALRAAEEEARRVRAEEEARLRAAEEARQKAAEEARQKAEAAEKARIRAEEEATRKAQAEEAARRKAEEDARRKAEAAEKARIRAEAEAKRKAEAEEAARRKAEEEARKKAEAARRIREADEARLRAEEAARLKAEQQARAPAAQGTAPSVERQPLPPPARPERRSGGSGAGGFDAPSIDEFLKSLLPGQ